MNKQNVKKFYFFLLSIVIFFAQLPFMFAKSRLSGVFSSKKKIETLESPSSIFPPVPESEETSVYDSLKLGDLGLSREAYDYAMKGFEYLRSLGKLSNDRLISIVDFSLGSAKKRLFVLDLENYKILFNTYVAHGKNSGKEYATEFSNQPESNKSSLGFYTTQNTYTGTHGYSLRIEGEEKGINDNAETRDIVIHKADYVNERMIKARGFIGRSQGCPALSPKLYKAVIDKIKNGTCLFIFGKDDNYISQSPLIHQSLIQS